MSDTKPTWRYVDPTKVYVEYRGDKLVKVVELEDTPNHLCYLHRDHPDRPRWDALGFPACPKGNFLNEDDVQMHMAWRHAVVWPVVRAFHAERAAYLRTLFNEPSPDKAGT
jgi:hypothetical protein